MTSSRRDFIRTTAAASAALSVPSVWTANSFAQDEDKQDANSKLTVASIGVGGPRGRYNRGGGIARNAARLGQMIAVCDVDALHNEKFNESFGGKLNTYIDYRRLFENEKPDIVTIGTPDHWHVPIAIHALRSGADVYCEKPLTLTIQEGIDICKVVEETGRIFQVGTQQRSENSLRFLKAVAMVQGGYVGDNVNAYVAIGGAPAGGPFKSTAAPEGLDWDMWVGPAPKADYSVERRKMFRWWFEYSGGKMTDWGAHHIDIAQWALGQSDSGPVRVSGKGELPPLIPQDVDWNAFLDGEIKLPDGFNTATKFGIDLEFQNGATMHVTNHFKRDDGTDFGNGILFEGSKGRIFVNRGKLTGKPVDQLTDADNEKLNAAVTELYKGRKPGDHMRNFFESVQDRKQPISDVFTHHRTMTSCHMCNITLLLGRELRWDPVKQTFIGDEQAVAMMSRKSRDGFV